MNPTAELPFRRAGVDLPPPAMPFSRRWYGRLLLVLLGVALQTAAFAPVKQFYLAWVGLVPWLLVIGGVRSLRGAFLWGWIAGTLFFVANMWWMATITLLGMFGLMALLGLYWGYAALTIHGARLLRPLRPGDEAQTRLARWPGARLVLLGCAWVAAAEWFRGTWPWHGLPWLYLGHTQTPLLPICQIADLTGVAGLSFLIVLTNGWLALWFINRLSVRGLQTSGGAVLLLIAASFGYGLFRLHSEQLTDGPKVLVVQPNYPQDNSGQKGATPEEMMAFHLDTTRSALRDDPGTDLVVWSETMLPPINPQAHTPLIGTTLGQIIDASVGATSLLARRFDVGILSGGEYWADIHPQGDILLARERRNSSYFFDRAGQLSAARYDKSHLVPFGEFTPFHDGLPWLYRLIVHFGPPDMEYYNLQSGDEKALTVFPLTRREPGPPWRLVTPICFEDIDANVCARMFRPDPASPQMKRADVLINLTNDGWFLANENAEHFQAAVFRSIENRVPTARSVNTGISGFVDPLGRAYDLLRARTAGTSTATVQLDARVTFFTRHGPVFEDGCVVVAVGTIFVSLIGGMTRRRRGGAPLRGVAS